MRSRFIAVIGVVVVLAAAWFMFAFRPGQAKLGDLRDQNDQAMSEVQQLEAELTHLKELQQRAPELRGELEKLSAALPAQPDLPRFIDELQDQANRSGVDFLSIAPSLPVPVGPDNTGAQSASELQVISISIATAGTFDQVHRFVQALEGMPRAVKIDDFSLGGGSEAGLEASPRLSVTMKLQMYMLSDAATVTEAPPAEAPADASAG